MSFRWLALVALCVLLNPVHAQPVTAAAPSENNPEALQPVEPPSQEEQLRTLLDTIKEVETERATLSRQLKRTADTAEAKQLNDRIEQIANRLKELQTAFEQLATGGISGLELQRQAGAAFNWQKELEDVLRPLFDELKQLTERPRTIERLRSERTMYQNQIQTADAAMAHIEKTLMTMEDPVVKKALKATLEQWQSYQEDASSHLQRINIQLERLAAPTQEPGQGLAVTLQEFANGRGLNLVLALGGFTLMYLVLAGLGRLVGRVMNRGREPGTRRTARVVALCFRVLTLILALFVASLILYARGDWLLLGLLILLVISFLWGLRQSLPRYMQEIRTLLSMGGVREGERVIYEGVPWKITSLNLYSTLHNPLLRRGVLRLPLDRMVSLQSRPYAPQEPWFPSQENDIVILDGDIYGKVLLQTPEVVQLQVIGATTSYTVANYLGKNPRNLSRDGFAVPMVVGLDYRHQGEILTGIVPALRTYLEEQLKEQPFHPYLTTLLVEFNEAASSSLNLLLVAVFTGAGADHYWSIRRFLQRATVSACNQYGWTIPFDQLTVHLPPAQQRLPR
ncbi:hypothetical protein [Candidatus Contendibacter odensensis]|uniref:Mechanosensitive ion channel protein MscS n=1 Tax=Candidatus Contendobacter odensis Run_B_J11 TaxID=1400861 RepID=A0A7U7G8K0_9GAMM|nr:hypothetical protein [Candidatus Contendobacter odensis]CDH43560.1 conserved membrane hypothetical protein [Candidatus Contendobacter odensis Run_B_J11]